MRGNRTYNKLLLVINIVYGLFCCVAIDYRTQSAGLPEEFSGYTSRKGIRSIDNVPVHSQYDIDFALSRYRIGDVVHVESSDARVESFPSEKIEANPVKPKHLLTIHTAGYKFVK